MVIVRTDPPARLPRIRGQRLADGSTQRDDNFPLPGFEGIREESRPLPEVAAVPFALTGEPLLKSSPRARTSCPAQVAATTSSPGRPDVRAAARARLPLLECLILADKGAVIALPGDGPEALLRWFQTHEPAHGEEKWFARLAYLIAEGLWDRARQAAVCAHVLSIVRAHARATTQEERDALMALVKVKLAATPAEG